jgi:hypothetical protein
MINQLAHGSFGKFFFDVLANFYPIRSQRCSLLRKNQKIIKVFIFEKVRFDLKSSRNKFFGSKTIPITWIFEF